MQFRQHIVTDLKEGVDIGGSLFKFQVIPFLSPYLPFKI
jgi:hypothetical protein